MSLIAKTRALQATLITAAMVATSTVMAQGFGSNPSQINGPSAGQISTNIAGSLGGISKGFEAFLYFLGVVFMVLFILAAWKYKKSDGREGNMGLICTYLVLAVCSFAAPTVMGSASVTIFGNGARTGVSAPTSTPNFN